MGTQTLHGAPDPVDLHRASHQRSAALLGPVVVELGRNPAAEPCQEVVRRDIRVVVRGEVVERRDQRAQDLVKPCCERLREPILLVQRGKVRSERMRGGQPRNERPHGAHADSTRT